jgi:hypothetical protein
MQAPARAPYSQILTCHLILSITLTPLLRAYTYVLFIVCTLRTRLLPPRSTRDVNATTIGRAPSEIYP